MSEVDQTIESEDEAPSAAQAGSADGNPGSPGAKAPGGTAAQAGKADAAVGETPATTAEPAGDGDTEDAAEVQGDLKKLMKAAAQRDEYLALAQRTQADFENYRKRVAKEARAAQERGVAGLARELLPALDNLDRALDAAASDDPLLDGVRLVRVELGAALARMGIESFSPLGEPFDPAVHEAVATAPQPPEGEQSGTVVEVYQQGYRLGSTVIRPARVVVAA